MTITQADRPILMPFVHDELVERATQLTADPASPSRATGRRWWRPAVLAPAAAGFVVALVAVLIATKDTSPPTAAPTVPAEAVAATPIDAANVVRTLGRQPSAPIPADDPIIAQAHQELATDGVDQTRGVRVPLPGTSDAGWLVGGSDTVCLVLPATRGTTVNCQEARDALEHGFGAALPRRDPAQASGTTYVLIVPPGSRTPYVAERGTTVPVREADVSDNGAIAVLTVQSGEVLVNPAALAGQQRRP